MKLLSLLFITLSLYTSAQTFWERHPDVSKKIEAVDKDSTLRKMVLAQEEFMAQTTDGGGELVGYLKDNKVQKIKLTVGVSYGNSLLEYYFDANEQLFFVYETLEEFVYDDGMGTYDYTQTETNYIGRYLFFADHLIDYETTGEDPYEGDVRHMEKMLVLGGIENLALVKRKAVQGRYYQK